jgi:DNA-directed RNA polymerase specialized sigma24 family protein
MSGSVTGYLQQLMDGQAEAAGPLWERYFDRLVQVARQMLQGTPRGMADEEDVALEALHSLCRGAGAGRFPQLCDREGLWRLLLVITCRKALNQRQRERSQKRGGGQVCREADLDRDGEFALDQLAGAEPTPELAALMADQCRRLLDRLDEGLCIIARDKLEGYTSEEIAGRLGCSLASVERKLRRIRHLWEGHDEP